MVKIINCEIEKDELGEWGPTEIEEETSDQKKGENGLTVKDKNRNK